MVGSSPTARTTSGPQDSIDDSKTPTRSTFTASDQSHVETTRDRSSSPPQRESLDVDMDDSDNEGGTHEDNDGSDDDSINADGSKSSKKKKSQRFYCTDYPPCNLSFTRSEHLARHIRKHTGERPFQCHCSRRFSRLDNLRQHAQTVHVNEDIPIDSLAATGSRFQRQMRTDRVRQAGNRARASTGGSAGGPQRGHSKSLSTSSINSIGSVGSAYAFQPDTRRRPPPLVMAADPRSRASLESYRSNADSNYSFRPNSPSDFSTPTSATFSTAQSSPRWPSGMGSPTFAHSRSHSMYAPGDRTPARRLSVPSGVSPYQPGNGIPGRVTFGPALINTSNPAAFAPSNNSLVSSPTASTSGWSTRRDSTSSATDEVWRRRTWHPDSRPFNGPPGHLNAVANSSPAGPNPPPPMANPISPQSNFRLPGIESFDPILQRAPSPPRRHSQHSPMMIDSEASQRPPGLVEGHHIDERRNLNMYDASLQRGITRLDISRKTPPRENASSWANEANRAVQAQAERAYQHLPTVRFEEPPSSHLISTQSMHQHTMSAPSFTTSREAKRHGWYRGPPAAPQQSLQDGRAAQVEKMVHPNFTGFSGFPTQEQQTQQQQDRASNPDSLRRLEALVAVATSEGSTATAY